MTTIPGLSTTLTSVDRAADLFEVSDTSDSGNSKKTSINSMLDLTSHPMGIDDVQTVTNKTLTAPTISSPVLSGTVTGTYTIAGTPTFPAAVVTLTGSQTLTNKTLTSPTITSPTIANPTITVDTISEFTAANGVTIDGVLLKDSTMNGSYLTDNTVTGVKLVSYRSQLQAITTNTTETALVMQQGWSFITGTGANTAEKTITFPTGFTSIKNVVVGAIGLITGSDPTAITSFNAGFSGNNVMLHPYSITTTNMVVRGTLDSSATLASNIRVGFSWVAWGTV